VRYRGVRLGVCLLALCGMAPMGVRSHGRIAKGQASLFDQSQRCEPINEAFGSGAQGSRSKQGWDSHLRGADAATYASAPVFSGDSRMALAGRADKTEWSGSSYKFESDRHVSSSLNNAAASRTMSILCADYNVCIEYDPPAARFGFWLGDAAPLDGSYLSSTKFGWTYGGVMLGNAGSASPATNAAGDVTPAMLRTSASNALTSDSGLAGPGTVTHSALAVGDSGIVTVAGVGAVSNNYQGASSRALTDSMSSDDNFGQTDPLHFEGGSDAPRVTPPVIQHASEPGSNSSGRDSTPIVNSELQAAGNQVINQSASSVTWWPTFGTTPDGPGSNPWPPEFHDPGPVYQPPSTSVSDPSNPAIDPGLDPTSPVPEPSQLVLMFTVIALTALAAKRSAFKRRAAARPGV
jgi:hypothetical protein